MTKSGNAYIVNKDFAFKQEVHDEKLKIENSHDQIFNQLTEYVQGQINQKLSEDAIAKLHHSFCNHLLDESNGDQYLEYISAFIISNDKNSDFVSKLKIIREGVILHSGVKYTNDAYDFNDFGNWRSELNIFLDTEIIFHLAGYNGTVYQEIAEDFFQFVHEINTKSKDKKLINLLYFPEVKKEIEGFFTKAKHILEGRETINPKVTAMVEILRGCLTNSDILSKRSDLYTLLTRKSIAEFKNSIDISDPKNYRYNIISSEVIEEINSYLQIDNCEDLLDVFNRISILRKNNNEENFENARYILLSGNSKTLRAAFNTSVYDRFRIPLATNLNFIINRFWFKLNKGFSKKVFPSSFSIITKSQIILSKILNDSIGEKYDELQTKFKKGEITKEQAINRVNDLRSSAKKPEEIKEEITNEILDFVTLDSLDDYIEKQNHYKEKIKKLDIISTELQIETEKNNNLKKQLVDSKKVALRDKEQIIDKYNSQLSTATRYGYKTIARVRVIMSILVIIFYTTIVGFIFYFGWDAMEKYTYIIGIPITMVIIIDLILKKTIRLDDLLESYRKRLINNRINRLSKYSAADIDDIKKSVQSLKEEITDLEN